jgi:hypothetical protein
MIWIDLVIYLAGLGTGAVVMLMMLRTKVAPDSDPSDPSDPSK